MNYHPPVGFSFKVEFEDISTSQGDNSFQSVSGLSVDLETEEITEGGENRFKHTIPVRSKYPNLVLKRGMLVDSEVIKWCKDALGNFEIQPVNINVMLLGEDEQTIQTWNVKHAYPVKWNVGDFNAEESKLVIETLELSYNYFKIV
ncbi:phage tail-like protein [Tenacibaculum gallaicum]|uniref:Phage tail-like protein n=1 Tax=Tenacibaculum gallaicum TaxID=561505 RepID=A0A3E0HJK2_9FLAO|nr:MULTISPECIES: phage tail protein [Tenacibaculum]MDO6675267.1 phage tail protein [Tenacibaculum sp. 1_MG-2023]MDX8553702.1 phage tail protein [Tenacibaculum sp. 1B UA]REH46376.1 phage tail-like protein [Tenacibaculum gallaicum]